MPWASRSITFSLAGPPKDTARGPLTPTASRSGNAREFSVNGQEESKKKERKEAYHFRVRKRLQDRYLAHAEFVPPSSPRGGLADVVCWHHRVSRSQDACSPMMPIFQVLGKRGRHHGYGSQVGAGPAANDFRSANCSTL